MSDDVTKPASLAGVLFADKGDAAPSGFAAAEPVPRPFTERRIIRLADWAEPEPLRTSARTAVTAGSTVAQPLPADTHTGAQAPLRDRVRRRTALASRRKKFTFRLDTERHSAFRHAAENLGCSGQRLLMRLLEEHLKQQDEERSEAAV